MILDFHVHCFPDDLARRAVPAMAARAGIGTALDGTLGALAASMDRAGIDIAVVQPIATRPGQERSVNGWAVSIRSARILAFGSIHPATPDWRGEIARLKDLGLLGVKFHPDYQDFFVDDPAVFPLYEALCEAGLAILFHAGVDLGLPEPCHCTPARLRRAIDAFPGGRFIAAHLGGYLLWKEAREHLVGRPLYLDTSYCFHKLGAEDMREIILAHGTDRILFGSDSPWGDQGEAVAQIRGLGLAAADEEAILAGNAGRMLGRALSVMPG
ncbi:MAG: amidohydrolase family protein [Patescibacteria group bacterium]